MTRRTIVGIDLGTTNSLVGVLQAGVPVLIPNALGTTLTPSAVSVDDDGQMLVGAPARARALSHPELTAIGFKRDMGTARRYRLGKRELRAEELSACVLASLRADAEAMLGHPIEEAVITVPAYFGDLQRQATRDAGAIAGLTVERIINEPTAAALAYGLQALDREMKAVVLDLGGGTFDVTVLEIIEGVLEIQSSAGDVRLGGDDFVDALAELVTRRIGAALGSVPATDPRTRARIRDACEAAKCTLSAADIAGVALPRLRLADARELDVAIDITRADAEETWRVLLERIRVPIHRALMDARIGLRNVDEVLLVGGATRMPCFVELAARELGRLPLRSLPPDEAVAHGAAIQAALKAGDAAVDELVVTDVAPFTLGIETATREDTTLAVHGIYTPIIERGTVIPASRVKTFSPITETQKHIDVEIYQGEHAMTSANTKLGACKIRLPSARQATDRSIDIRFTYDLNGILEVDVTVQATGEQTTLVIEQRPGALAPREVADARKRMAALKFHPRESLPNRTALAHADELFAGSTGDARVLLLHEIARFRLCLERQDPTEIEAAREQLLGLLDVLRRGDERA